MPPVGDILGNADGGTSGRPFNSSIEYVLSGIGTAVGYDCTEVCGFSVTEKIETDGPKEVVRLI